MPPDDRHGGADEAGDADVAAAAARKRRSVRLAVILGLVALAVYLFALFSNM